MVLPTADVEVNLKTAEGAKAVIEGRTAVPFKTFVQLVLQRKVMALFKDWSESKLIVDAELLTSLASAPQDNQENRNQVVLVTMATGVLLGIFAFATLQLGLLYLDVILTKKELGILVGGFAGLGILLYAFSKAQRVSRAQKITDSMEKLTAMISKK